MSVIAAQTTTLSAAMDRATKRVSVASGTGITAGVYLVIGAEIVLVQVVITATTFDVERGQFGTAAKPHASGAATYVSSSSVNFATLRGRPVVKNDITSPLPDMPLPVGSRMTDPETGYEYLTVDCQSAMQPGHWVTIDSAGLATLLTGDYDSTTAARVGLIVETIGSSDRFALALVKGRYAGALCTSAFTSLLTPSLVTPTSINAGMVGVAPSGAATSASSGTSGLANIIYGVVVLDFLTSAVSSAGTLDVLLMDPYVAGVPVYFSQGETS